MSLLTVLQKGIKLADKIVKPLEATVSFTKFVSSGDGYGSAAVPEPTAVSLRAIVEWKDVQLPTATGLVDVTRPTVLFLDTAALLAATNGEGVKEEDSIVLGDGTTGPVRLLSGFFDASINRPIYTEVALG